MRKKLAIKGHPTRGKEVIALLEMMGGINDREYIGTNTWKDKYYFLDNGYIRAYDWCDGIKFTLEEFLWKYPYKVGDKVVYEDDNDIVVISEIMWDDTVGDIFYNVKRIDEDDCFLCPPELLKPYKETNMNTKKKFAIAGHLTRGKEIIELLEMMGGVNWKGHLGNAVKRIYYIHESGLITYEDINDISLNRIDEYKIFTLEEFLEKYPFKVGGLVDRNIDYVSCIIDDMRWNSEKCCVEYHLNYLNGSEYGWHVSDCLVKPENVDVITETKIESTGFMQMEKTASVIFNSENYDDEVELQLGDYEIEVRDGKTYAVKKRPKYPTTYEECCEMLGIEEDLWFVYEDIDANHINPACISNYRMRRLDLYHNLEKLLICRDAYWKILGEQMSLGKPWEPDWSSFNEDSYPTITKCNGRIVKTSIYTHDCPLAFPTAEMRDAFYENFKDLIETCKELL